MDKAILNLLNAPVVPVAGSDGSDRNSNLKAHSRASAERTRSSCLWRQCIPSTSFIDGGR